MSTESLSSQLDWAKGDGLLPVIVQHAHTLQVLMLGYMNAEALQVTQDIGRVTFYSRSKQRLWTKGESSNHFLNVVEVRIDCDQDTILVTAIPQGPTCHNGTASCFGDAPASFIGELDALVARRKAQMPEGSYTTKLFTKGTRYIAQKVGEEGVETALAAVAQGQDELVGEAADLMFHLLVLLRERGLGLDAVQELLQRRHADPTLLHD